MRLANTHEKRSEGGKSQAQSREKQIWIYDEGRISISLRLYIALCYGHTDLHTTNTNDDISCYCVNWKHKKHRRETLFESVGASWICIELIRKFSPTSRWIKSLRARKKLLQAHTALSTLYVEFLCFFMCFMRSIKFSICAWHSDRSQLCIYVKMKQ